MNIIQGQKVVNFAQLYLKMPFRNAIGIGFEENGYILGGVIFDDFKNDAFGKLQSCEGSVIILDKRCINRYTLKHIFELPFIHLKLKRLQARSGRKEKHKRQLLERLGFQYEGILREAWPYGGDCACYSMLKQECRYLDGFKPQDASRSQSDCNGERSDRQQSANGTLSSRA